MNRKIIGLFFLAAMTASATAGQSVPPPTGQELEVFRNRAQLVLGHHLDDYYFMGHNAGPPPRPGCVLDKRVKDPHVPNLYHAGWRCPKQH